MRKAPLFLAGLLIAASASAMGTRPPHPAPGKNVLVSNLKLEGAITGENITFTLTFDADVRKEGAELPVVAGDTAYLESSLPRDAELRRMDNRYLVTFKDKGSAPVSFRFASRPAKQGDWRQTSFRIPSAGIKKLSLTCDRPDLEVKFPDALNVERHKNKEGNTVVTAHLGLTRDFRVSWKPEVRKLEGELAVACDANTIVSASVGALEMDTVFEYKVVQGSLRKLSFRLPAEVSVTQVQGDDIQDWTIEKVNGRRELLVTLRRTRQSNYRIRIQSETVLPEFPCRMVLPVIAPSGVIRSSGFLMIGTDSAIKLIIRKAAGLTQVDQASFPRVNLDAARGPRPMPSRSKFAYQYANMPYTLELAADNIVPEYSARDQLVLSVKDNDLVLNGKVNLDVRNAPAREIEIEVDPEWIVANVECADISDYDIITGNGKQVIRLFFRDAVLGRTLVNFRLEKIMEKEADHISAPRFRVKGAESERGYLVLALEKGLRILDTDTEGLREIHTGSVDVRIERAQLAFRFKKPGWSFKSGLEQTRPTIHSEVLHLVSIREGILYCSSAITFHVSGAPVRQLQVHVPEPYQNVEFTGRGIRNWTQKDNLWTVSLQEKIMGDYTLLVAYDRQFNYEGQDVDVGGVRTVGTTSEAGYIALASSASLNLSENSADDALIRIDRSEVPSAYNLLINDPVLKAYKYTSSPHVASINIERHATERLLDQVTDHSALFTEISRDGETVTTATYSVKNLARQYFTISLPDEASLWSVEVSDGNEGMKSVTPLRREERILIPVSRQRNPNLPVKVKVIYAESRDRIAGLGGSMNFASPGITDSHSTFTEWRFKCPPDYAVSSTGGNMVGMSATATRGLLAFLSNTWNIAVTVLKDFTALLVFVLLAAAIICLWSYSAGRGKGLVWQVPFGILILVILFFGAMAIQASLGAEGIEKMLHIVAPQGAEHSEAVFTRTLSLAEGDTLEAEIRIMPAWLGAEGSFGKGLLFALLGIVALHASRRIASTYSMAALGLLLLTYGVSQVYYGKLLLLGAFYTLLPLVLLIKLARVAYRRGRTNRIEPPPFEPDPPTPGTAAPGPVPATKNPGVDPADQNSSYGYTGYRGGETQGTSGNLPPFKNVPCEEKKERSGNKDSGYTLLRMLILMSLLGTAVAASPVQNQEQHTSPEPHSPVPVMENVKIEVDAPEMEGGRKASARVTASYRFETDKALSFVILAPPAVLTGTQPESRHLSIRAGTQGYVLDVKSKGKHELTLEYSIPVEQDAGTFSVTVGMPQNLRNRLNIRIPGTDLEVESPRAVLFRTGEKKNATEATAVYGTAEEATLTWKPRARRTGLEKVAFYCEMNSIATFQPGVVEIVSLVRYQIAQGELKSTTLTAPRGMNVTSVSAPALSTWRFDPETRKLEAVLERPVTGEFTLTVVSQIPCEGLPYEADVGSFEVEDALRLRGALALASLDTVQVQVDSIEGLDSMNIEDIASETVAAAKTRNQKSQQAMEVKRAFRYHELPVLLSATGKRVLPEIRVKENASLSISSERVVLSSVLDVNISKAGVFSLELQVPGQYEVESLSGTDVSHWDELTGTSETNGRTLVVHFAKKARGNRKLNLEVTRTEREIGETIAVPRISVKETLKHNGTLVVSAERGVRTTTIERKGISELNPRELGIRQSGVLAFRLLRPDWLVKLKTEVVDPLVRTEVLQKVEISEGMHKGTVYVNYDIDHAGVKTFHLQSPSPEIPLAVTGKDIAKVSLSDREKGIWRVELHSKRQNSYSLQVQYQDNDATLVLPLKTLNVESQKGHVAVFSSGRAQVRPAAVPEGLKRENSMAIPAFFGAGDLSDAIYAYRAIGPDYRLDLSVTRHDAAEVIPAKGTDARLTSVVSADGQVLTEFQLSLLVGDLRFLEMTLPGSETLLWAAFVNGKAATVSKDGDIYRIPLDETVPGQTTRVEITYAARPDSSGLLGKSRFVAPRIHGLPLNNIDWEFYMIPNRRYHGFNGTMQLQETETEREQQLVFQRGDYSRDNLRRIQKNTEKAKEILKKGEEYAEKGKQMLARKAMESAVNYSRNDVAFNEDARIQFRNLAQQQAVVGLVQRRDEMRFARNIHDEQQMKRMQQFHEGRFTADYARRVQQSLPESESSNLMRLAGKIMDQQQAAEEVSRAIQVVIPTRGKQLRFYRRLHIDPDAELSVVFKTSSGSFMRLVLTAMGAIALFFVFRAILAPWRTLARQ